MIDGLESGEEPNVLDEMFASDRDRSDNDASLGDDKARDELGRFAPKEEPPEPAPETAQEAQTDPESQPENNPEPDRRVPLSELQNERRKRQEYEQQYQQLQRESAERDAQYQAYLRQLQQPQEAPDILDDPEGFVDQRLSPIEQKMENSRLDMSEDRARERFGDDTVNQAMQAAQQMGILSSFVQSRHPYGDLIQWFQRESTLKEVGTDPKAYREKLAKEIREEVLAELKSGNSPGQPSHRFPTSLADQTSAGGNNGAVLTDQALMDGLFDSRRDRRQG